MGPHAIGLSSCDQTPFGPADANHPLAAPRASLSHLSGTFTSRCVDRYRRLIYRSHLTRFLAHQAHAGLIGTARPTHYCVLADENGFNSDEIQRLTNSLSFVFGRATRSVSLVTPAYYADIALEKCRVLAATEFDDTSTTVSGHSGDRDAPVAMLDPEFFCKKFARAQGFHNMWCVRKSPFLKDNNR